MLLYRPILRAGVPIGYLWATPEQAGYHRRAGSDDDPQVRAFWMRWLMTARESGLTAHEAMASWNPSYEFPYGAPAIGPPTPLPDFESLQALASGSGPAGGYPDETTTLVRHYPVIRAGQRIGHLWASVDDEAAGFVPIGLPDTDPAIPAWRHRLTEAHTFGLTPVQALDAMRDAPDDGTTGRLSDPLGQAPLADLGRC